MVSISPFFAILLNPTLSLELFPGLMVPAMVRSLGICSASYLSAMAWSMVSGAPYEPMPPKATVMPLSMSLAASSFVILFISDPPFLKYGFILLIFHSSKFIRIPIGSFLLMQGSRPISYLYIPNISYTNIL